MTDFGIIHYLPSEENSVYIKQMHLDAGYEVMTHVHKYDHYGVLGKGKAMVELDGSSEVYTGPCVIEIKAGKQHKITAIETITWFCIHATDETDVDKIDSVLIKEN